MLIELIRAGGRMTRLGCENIEELANLYVDGELDQVTRIRFEQHISSCDICREVVLELTHLLNAARSLEDKPMPEDVGHRLRENLRKRVGYDYTRSTPQLRLIPHD